MADLVFRGMEMPKNCMDCPLVVCLNTKDDCPIFPLQEGHGKLIDADELMNRARGCLDELTMLSVEFLVNGSSTIVPAEGGGEDGV